MDQVKKNLQKVRELLADPEHWMQGYSARRANGHHTYPEDPQAVSWCLFGALRKVTSPGRCDEELFRLKEAHGDVSTIYWNDHPLRKHEEVVALLDWLIAE